MTEVEFIRQRFIPWLQFL